MSVPTPHRGKATLRCGDVVDVAWWRFKPGHAECREHRGWSRSGQVVESVEQTEVGNISTELGAALTMLESAMQLFDTTAEKAAKVAREHPGYNAAMHSLIDGLAGIQSVMQGVQRTLMDEPSD